MCEECFSTLLKWLWRIKAALKTKPRLGRSRGRWGYTWPAGTKWSETLSAQTPPERRVWGSPPLINPFWFSGDALRGQLLWSLLWKVQILLQHSLHSWHLQTFVDKIGSSGAEEVFDQRYRALEVFLQSHCLSCLAEVGPGWMICQIKGTEGEGVYLTSCFPSEVKKVS